MIFVCVYLYWLFSFFVLPIAFLFFYLFIINVNITLKHVTTSKQNIKLKSDFFVAAQPYNHYLISNTLNKPTDIVNIPLHDMDLVFKYALYALYRKKSPSLKSFYSTFKIQVLEKLF